MNKDYLAKCLVQSKALMHIISKINIRYDRSMQKPGRIIEIKAGKIFEKQNKTKQKAMMCLGITRIEPGYET